MGANVNRLGALPPSLPPPLTADERAAISALVDNDPWIDAPDRIHYFGAIIGGERPSRYSQSPRLWTAFFAGLGVPGYFCALDLANPQLLPQLLRVLTAVPACIDITITNPYKTEALAALDAYGTVALTARATHLGCINHVVPHPIPAPLGDPMERPLVADNTDGRGMVRALEARLQQAANRSLRGTPVLLVGAGGAAAAIGYELVQSGAVLTITNIVAEDAARLARRLRTTRSVRQGAPPGANPPRGESVAAGGWESLPQAATQARVIVSAITSGTPFTAAQLAAAAPNTLCADVRYGPNALFAHAAAAAGQPTLDGREMLFGQFQLAAEIAAPLWRLETARLPALFAAIAADFLR